MGLQQSHAPPDAVRPTMSANNDTSNGGEEATTRIQAESAQMATKLYPEASLVSVEAEGSDLVRMQTAFMDGDFSVFIHPQNALTLAGELEEVATALIEDGE